ncbi:MAG TPA: molybdopterin converting factor subunit 1 [Gammaproteobacteria bacterium]|nr:molybdopterin converting factor subunit 1 [Gammaproteobacteria bacterium]
MTIHVKFFASLREQMGRAEVTMEPDAGTTVAQVWEHAACDVPMPDNLLAAVNMEYADFDQAVSDGDEVAFFPPVTGG